MSADSLHVSVHARDASDHLDVGLGAAALALRAYFDELCHRRCSSDQLRKRGSDEEPLEGEPMASRRRLRQVSSDYHQDRSSGHLMTYLFPCRC